MRVLNLCHGKGNGVDKACLMTASNMLIGKGKHGDYNSCVCPILQRFIFRTNDRMPVELLGELYGPLAWEIIGTRNDKRSVIEARVFKLVDWQIRVMLPKLLELLKDDRREVLLSIAGVKDADSAMAARDVIRAHFKKPAAAAAAVAAAAYAAYKAWQREYWSLFPQIIREISEIGDLRPKEVVPEIVLSESDLVAALS